MILLAPFAAVADELRIDLPELQRPYLYGESSPAVAIDLGTPLLALESIEVELAGVHTEGWWVGDMVEDFYVGPKGGVLILKMDSASPLGSGWKASYVGWDTGPFIVTVPLHRAGGGSDWSFLEDGITDLTIIHDYQLSWGGGGGFTTDPVFDLTDVRVVINATPVPEPATLAALLAGAMVLLRRGAGKRRR